MIVADCGPLDDFDNGLVNTESGTTYNSVALYTCNEGYLLNGRARRTCLPSGEWALFTSSCIRKLISIIIIVIIIAIIILYSC